MSEEAQRFGSLPDDSTEAQVRDSGNVLDDLRDALKESADIEPVEYAVPQRASHNITLTFNPDIEFDLLRSFMRAAARNKKKEFNPLAFAYSVISHTNTGISIRGRQAFNDDGTAMTVVSREFHAMIGGMDTVNAIRKLFGVDGHMIQCAQNVVDAAGYGDVDLEGDGPDPLGL